MDHTAALAQCVEKNERLLQQAESDTEGLESRAQTARGDAPEWVGRCKSRRYEEGGRGVTSSHSQQLQAEIDGATDSTADALSEVDSMTVRLRYLQETMQRLDAALARVYCDAGHWYAINPYVCSGFKAPQRVWDGAPGAPQRGYLANDDRLMHMQLDRVTLNTNYMEGALYGMDIRLRAHRRAVVCHIEGLEHAERGFPEHLQDCTGLDEGDDELWRHAHGPRPCEVDSGLCIDQIYGGLDEYSDLDSDSELGLQDESWDDQGDVYVGSV